MKYSLHNIITITILLLTHPMSHAAQVAPQDEKGDAAPTDEYKKARTMELAAAIAKAKEEERAQVIKEHVKKHDLKSYWGMPLREAVKLRNKDLVQFLIDRRANVSHGDWGETIKHPLYRPGYTEEPTFALAGNDKELLKILLKS